MKLTRQLVLFVTAFCHNHNRTHKIYCVGKCRVTDVKSRGSYGNHVLCEVKYLTKAQFHTDGYIHKK
jgi:hypothetical protein